MHDDEVLEDEELGTCPQAPVTEVDVLPVQEVVVVETADLLPEVGVHSEARAGEPAVPGGAVQHDIAGAARPDVEAAAGEPRRPVRTDDPGRRQDAWITGDLLAEGLQDLGGDLDVRVEQDDARAPAAQGAAHAEVHRRPEAAVDRTGHEVPALGAGELRDRCLALR